MFSDENTAQGDFSCCFGEQQLFLYMTQLRTKYQQTLALGNLQRAGLMESLSAGILTFGMERWLLSKCIKGDIV